MYYLHLFGSRASGENRPDSDVDVVITDVKLDGDRNGPQYTEDQVEEIVKQLFPHAIENGGKLDLFTDDGCDFLAVYDMDNDRRIMIGSAKHGHETVADLERYARGVSVEEIMALLESIPKKAINNTD